MTLSHFLELLEAHPNHGISLMLPDGSEAPPHFHITEVAHSAKTFLDCGGKRHSTESCVLQVWVADDFDHRVRSGKLAKIVHLGRDLFPTDSIEVEFEHEAPVLTRLTIDSFEASTTHLIFRLALQKADCLAKDICLPKPNYALPPIKKSFSSPSTNLFSIDSK